MHIIPVIDVCRGQVVHALRGQRENYQPIVSTLCTGSDPHDIVQALLNVYPFDTLYIADLDAISGIANNHYVLASLRQRFPTLHFWLDSGPINLSTLLPPDVNYITPVIGTETGIHIEQLQHIVQLNAHAILSLDYRDSVLMGDLEILNYPEKWPEQCIVMNLSRVGSESGPDLQQLKDIMARAPDRSVYSAGGIRNMADLQQLRMQGVKGALLATALHSGTITGKDLSILR